MQSVKLSELIEKMELNNVTPEVAISETLVMYSGINIPSLQLTGFFEFFDNRRIQIIGNVEQAYLEQHEEEDRLSKYEELFKREIPCLIYCAGLKPGEKVICLAKQYNIPILLTDQSTSPFVAEIIRWLKVKLSPNMTVHGVLVDVYGEGILIMGESGIGKSEAAIELVRRGHRLVTDDVVEIHKVSDETLIGTSPDITRHFIELRGIGIIDVKTLFGVESVKDTQAIDMVIRLEDWNKEKEYDRLGLIDEYTEFLGNKVVCHSIPIRSGRNLAIIVESAAVNHRQKKMGYNAAQELYRRVQENIERKG
jgi:HPr kinase/phosphorylase